MPNRIPKPTTPLEVRRAFQQMRFNTDVLTTGGVGQVLIGAGVGFNPVWSSTLTTLESLTVDDITIDGAAITSGTGAISFGDEDLTTTGVIAGTTITGANVTSGEDPGHTHTGTLETITNGSGALVRKCMALYATAAGFASTAKADAYLTSEVIGLADQNVIGIDGDGPMRTSGILEATTAQWDARTDSVGGLTEGVVYYLSKDTAGFLTTTAPSSVGEYVVRVGKALTTTKMLIEISQPILL